jgi:hypothetical protein
MKLVDLGKQKVDAGTFQLEIAALAEYLLSKTPRFTGPLNLK